jgi:biopolymer transport protein ExbB/TolQ
VYTWAIIVSKTGALGRADRASRAFLARFRQSGVEWLSGDVRVGAAEGPLGKILEAGIRELRTQRAIEGAGRALSPHARERISAAIDAEIVEQVSELERGQIVLAIGASAGPLLGLLGTVWGIMNAFASMGMQGNAGIAAVAPGVAEALVGTVAGLAVAIPAVIAYNVHARKIQVITKTFDRFSHEFMVALDLAGRRTEARSDPRETAPESSSPVFARHRT